MRGCGHLDKRAEVHTVFAVKPNHVNCPRCAEKRGRELDRDFRRRAHLPGECDFCHLHVERVMLLPVVFNITNTLIRGFICTVCAIGQRVVARRVGS